MQRLRDARDPTQAETAKAMKMSRAALAKLERGSTVTLGALLRYVEAIGGQMEVHEALPSRRSPDPRTGSRVTGKRIHLVRESLSRLARPGAGPRS
jgi:transcriptional regulator with XRE-family HTH domain